MNRRRFLLSSAAGVAAFAQKPVPVQRPNILVVMADDLSAWMLGCYGNKEIKTPNIDTLARGGLRFTNAFCATPTGSPSRATFFTGRLPRQHGLHDLLATPSQSAPPSFASEIMISDLLTTAGYTCGYVGKWGMGNDQQPGHGYKYTYTMPAGSGQHSDPQMSLNGQVIHEKGYLADLVTQRAGEFLDKQTAASPFLLSVGYLNPSPPYAGHPAKYYQMYEKTAFNTFGWEHSAPDAFRDKDLLADILGNLQRSAAAITALDDQVGALVRKLQERKLWDNTLILVTSDNGSLLGRHGLWSDGLASEPPNMYEEVVKVPFILSWPGKIPTGEFAPEMVSFYDVLPTVCEAAAIAPPSNRNLTGRSFLAIAKRDPLPKNQPWRNLVFAQLRSTLMARDTRYKLVLRREGKGPNQLFDIASDPQEKVNRYEDPQFTSVRDRLTREVELWQKRAS